MITIRNPQGRPAPETYHHGIEVAGPTRTLYVAGQIGTLPDGSVAAGIEAQAEAVFANMTLVLDEAGMSFADIVKITVFLTDPADRAAFSAVRARHFGAAKPTSTLLYVAGLARPEMRVEVEAIAVAADPAA